MKKEVMLYSDIYYDDDDYKEMYKDVYGIQNDDEDSKEWNGYYDWLGEVLNDELDDLMSNLKYSKYNSRPYVILGNVGLWYGKREIVPVRTESLVDAINKCVCQSFSHYTTIKRVNGHIEVEINHHDGTNVFDIHMLNDKGIDTKNGNLADRRYHKAIKDYLY